MGKEQGSESDFQGFGDENVAMAELVKDHEQKPIPDIVAYDIPQLSLLGR